MIRSKKRFKWYKSGQNKSNNISELTSFHSKLRKKIQYIYGEYLCIWINSDKISLLKTQSKINNYVQRQNINKLRMIKINFTEYLKPQYEAYRKTMHSSSLI